MNEDIEAAGFTCDVADNEWREQDYHHGYELRCILYTHVRVGLSPRLPIASDTINNQPAMSVSVFGCTVKGRFALSPLALREHEFAHPFVRTLRGYSQLFLRQCETALALTREAGIVGFRR